MILLQTFDLSFAGRVDLPDPLPKNAHHIELWVTQVGDAGPQTHEYRLCDAGGQVLCTCSFYPEIQETRA